MNPFSLKHSVGAVSLDEHVAKSLPANSLVRVIGPSQTFHGFVDVECDGQLYAVFSCDLDNCRQLANSTAEMDRATH